MNSSEKPHANICLNNYCNYNCYYCQSGGENHGSSEDRCLELQDVKKILLSLDKLGVARVRFTGGEPTLLSYFGEILEYALSLNFSKIRIATNGYKITNHIEHLKNERVRVLLSLDTLDEEKFSSITGGGKLNTLIKAMKELSDNQIDTRINTVLMKSNLSELTSIIEHCKKMNFSIKLLGLELLDCFDKKRILDEWVDIDKQEKIIESIGIKSNEIMAPGNLGIPMNEYRNGDINIRVRFFDGWGAKYIETCESCPIFPCPSGIYGIQILADGEISLCRFRRGFKFNFYECKDTNEIYRKIERMLYETLENDKIITQKKEVSFGTKKFIEIPESIC